MCMKEECKTKNSMTLLHNRCRFADKQVIKVQETPDEIPDGGTPHTVSLLMHDKLVDAGKPGDRVETCIDCLHIKKTDKSRMNTEDPMETEQASTQDDQGTPVDYEEQAMISDCCY